MIKAILLQLLKAPFAASRARKREREQKLVRHAEALLAARNFDAVIAECRALLERGESPALAAHLCGRACLALGRPGEARGYLERALKADPQLAGAHADLGEALFQGGEHEAALDRYRTAISLAGDGVQYRTRLVELLEQTDRKQDLVVELLCLHDLVPGRVDILFKTFAEVSRLGMHAEAVRIAERALAEIGRNFDTLRLLASARYGAADMPGAIEACREAIAIRSNFPDIHVTLGSALFARGQVAEACEAYRQSLMIDPEYPDGRFHLGLMQIMQGQYAEGWQGFEYRFRRARRRGMRPSTPPWSGGRVGGGRLLVMREQGLGDEIMFASCYGDVMAQAPDALFECEPRLLALFSRSFPQAQFLPYRPEETPASESRNDIAARVYAGTLPSHFRKSAGSFPAHRGYLVADPLRVAYWQERLAGLGPGLKVGLSWRGGMSFTRQERRSFSLETMMPVLGTAGVQWINLQYGQRADEIAALAAKHGIRVHDWPEAIDGDYDETAALVSALDLVISVCTSVIHLSGALGKSAWVMTAKVPEWRYGIAGETMPWYPSVRLFRQSVQGEWRPVIQRIGEQLSSRVIAIGHRTKRQ